MKRMKPLLVVGLALLAAGCSTHVDGSPAPVTGVSAAPSASVPPGVPTVANPLDASRYLKEPCAALTSVQVSQLGITTQPKPMPGDALGPSCTWNGFDEAGLSVGGRFLSRGLSNLYAQHAQGQVPFFQPVADVSGYPGVLTDSLDAQPQGKCDMVVGLRTDQVYSVQVTIEADSKDYANPCPVAQKAAEMAVSTMKAGT